MSHQPEEEYFPEIVELPLEDVLDLHSFPPKEIKALLKDYLDDAYAAGFPEVRIIHGKGIGVQREIVRSVAEKHPQVASVSLAPEGWGASIVVFKSVELSSSSHKKTGDETVNSSPSPVIHLYAA